MLVDIANGEWQLSSPLTLNMNGANIGWQMNGMRLIKMNRRFITVKTNGQACSADLATECAHGCFSMHAILLSV